MKKTLLSAAIVLGAATAGTATAGGIQIDPTGTGNIASSTFLTSLGSSLGNFLADNALAGGIANTDPGGTTIYGHNSIPILGGELTAVFSIPMTASLFGADTLSLLQSSAGTFQLWFGPVNANQIAGTGYADGTLITSGVVTVVPPLSFSRTSATTGPLSAANGTAFGNTTTIFGNGSATITVDLTYQNNLFITNDVLSAANGVDLQVDNALRLDYTNGSGNRASETFNSTAVVPYFGSDAINNFACGGLEICDFEAQMNSTFLFSADRVPEPGTVALMGLGLGLLGGLRARRNKQQG